MPQLPLPSNIGKRRTLTDIDGTKQHFTVLAEVTQVQSDYPDKAIYLQHIRFEKDGRLELRLGYYIIGKKPKMAGKWVWGQYATMMPQEDFQAIIEKAEKEGWLSRKNGGRK
jgi:hypothetical protein